MGPGQDQGRDQGRGPELEAEPEMVRFAAGFRESAAARERAEPAGLLPAGAAEDWLESGPGMAEQEPQVLAGPEGQDRGQDLSRDLDQDQGRDQGLDQDLGRDLGRDLGLGRVPEMEGDLYLVVELAGDPGMEQGPMGMEPARDLVGTVPGMEVGTDWVPGLVVEQTEEHPDRPDLVLAPAPVEAPVTAMEQDLVPDLDPAPVKALSVLVLALA